jgi:hypothetical protein
VVKAGQPVLLQMHFVNPSDQVVHAAVTLSALAYEDGVQVTPAAPYIAYNSHIALDPAPSPSAPTSGTVSGSCNDQAVSTLKFYQVSAHTFKQGIHTSVKDGSVPLVDSTNWQAPTIASWAAAPFFTFSTAMAYECDYSNPNGYRITTGDLAATNEICVALGYFFPATDPRGHLCFNSTLLY